MDLMNDRITTAWNACQRWVQDIDGTPIITLLLDFPLEGLNKSISNLFTSVNDLKVTVINPDDPGTLSYITTEEINHAVEMFSSKSLAEISFDYQHELDDLQLDLHLRIYWVEKDKALIELNWWNDQLFTDDTDNAQDIFMSFVKYLLSLQSLFNANEIYLGRESSLFDSENGIEFLKI